MTSCWAVVSVRLRAKKATKQVKATRPKSDVPKTEILLYSSLMRGNHHMGEVHFLARSGRLRHCVQVAGRVVLLGHHAGLVFGRRFCPSRSLETTSFFALLCLSSLLSLRPHAAPHSPLVHTRTSHVRQFAENTLDSPRHGWSIRWGPPTFLFF